MIAINDYQIRKGDSFRFATEIHQPFGVLDQTLNWCKTALEDEWRWQMIQPSSDQFPGRYIFYFDSDRDYCAFCLRWC